MDALRRLADRQNGALTSAQAAAEGVGRSALHRLVQRGWSRLLPGVYLAPGAADSDEALMRAALLWAGPRAVLSHQAAGRLHGFDGMGDEVHVTIPAEQRLAQSSRARAHRAALEAEDRRVVRGFAATSTVRTLIDLAAVLQPLELAMALESALRQKTVRLDAVEQRLRALGHGHKGTTALARLLTLCRARRTLDSPLEVRLWSALEASALPPPVAGHPVVDDEGPPMRLDFAYPAHRVAVECDGYEVHSQRSTFERDAVRWSRLAACGWRVVHVTYAQLYEPAAVVARIGRALKLGRPSAVNSGAR